MKKQKYILEKKRSFSRNKNYSNDYNWRIGQNSQLPKTLQAYTYALSKGLKRNISRNKLLNKNSN